MTPFETKTFTIPVLVGISAKNIEEHLKLYAGYVKNTNLILEKIPEYNQWAEKDPFVTYYTSELQRRFAFEFNGMRNHEYYFHCLEGGATVITIGGPLHSAISETWGSFESFLTQFKAIALTRGVGWAWLYLDTHTGKLLTQWVDEQHIGHLLGLTPILGLDVWEHAFVADYQPSGKKQYVEDFFANLNWSVIEENYAKALK
jgi:superoxide dismutase, Fe-Mn family